MIKKEVPDYENWLRRLCSNIIKNALYYLVCHPVKIDKNLNVSEYPDYEETKKWFFDKNYGEINISFICEILELNYDKIITECERVDRKRQIEIESLRRALLRKEKIAKSKKNIIDFKKIKSNIDFNVRSSTRRTSYDINIQKYFPKIKKILDYRNC